MIVVGSDVLGVLRVPGDGVEVDHAVKGSASDEAVDRLALRFFFLAVIAVERHTVERILKRRERRADDAQVVVMRSGDQLLVPGNDVVGRGRGLVLSG